MPTSENPSSRNCLETQNRLPFMVLRACGTGRKGTLLGAARYREMRDPTRPATFQTVSLGTSVNRGSRAALSSMWHHRSAMPQYLVTMDITRADPLLPIDQLLGVIQEAVLPSVERLIELKAQRKVVTGGYPIGQRGMVFFIETDSEEELYELLESLPLSEIAEARVTPLKSFEELRWLD
jgi:muconolactone delta-isomerase